MDTRARIIESAGKLIVERGYAGFSYQDVSSAIGITKASIHHHFPAKEDLGLAVITKYREFLSGNWTEPASPGLDYWRALDHFLVPLVAFGREPLLACTAGVLCGEYPHLPVAMQQELAIFFNEQEGWLGRLLQAGKNASTFTFSGSASAMARLILSAIEGSLLIKRTRDDTGFFEGVLQTVRNCLGG